MRPALLDRRTEGGSLREQVVLADELVERLGAHARGERLVARGDVRLPPWLVFGVEQAIVQEGGQGSAAGLNSIVQPVCAHASRGSFVSLVTDAP